MSRMPRIVSFEIGGFQAILVDDFYGIQEAQAASNAIIGAVPAFIRIEPALEISDDGDDE